jgi:hypothetical protein
MQISGITSTPPMSMDKSPSPSPAAKADSDQAVLNFSADSFSSLVQEAAQAPEVRDEVVDAFKARIQSGEYPPAQTVAGLADAIGGAVVGLARSGASS